jgi:hypothetical protein
MKSFIERPQSLDKLLEELEKDNSVWLLTLAYCSYPGCGVFVAAGQQKLSPDSYRNQDLFGLIIVNDGNVALRVTGSCEAHKDKD